MNTVRAVLLALLTLCGTMTGVAMAAGVTASSSAATPTTEQIQSTTAESEASNATLGSQISAFMQSNAAEADGAIESGMWAAAFARSANGSTKADLVSKRTKALRNRLDTIEKRTQRLVERRSAGKISQLQYESKMSSLVGQYVALVEAINETERRAESTGMDAGELEQLREKSKRVPGQEMAAVARNMSGVDAPGLEKKRTAPGTAAATDTPAGNGTKGHAEKSSKRAGQSTNPTKPANASDVRGMDNGTDRTGAVGNATGAASDAANGLDAGNVVADSTDATNATLASGGSPPEALNGSTGEAAPRRGTAWLRASLVLAR